MANISECDVETDGGPSLQYVHTTIFQQQDEKLTPIVDIESKTESESVPQTVPSSPDVDEIKHDSGETLSSDGTESGASTGDSGLESPLSDLDLNGGDENEDELVPRGLSEDKLVPSPITDIRFSDFLNIDKDGDTHLHVAIILGRLHMVKLLARLMEDGFYSIINRQNKLFQTPLHLAVICGEHDIVRFLLSHQADLHLRDRHGRTVFHIVSHKGDIPMLMTLTRDGSLLQTGTHPLDIKDYNGETSLHVSTKNDNCDIVKALLNKGADVNIRDTKRGKSVLHIAAEKGSVHMVEYLLQRRDIDPDITTYDGESPLELAFIRGHKRVEKLLGEYACNLNLKHVAKYSVLEKKPA